ncbi:MAG: O-antigen ligase family protein [Spirochaetes bacterium]|nr:O-antigen ligase family protein [Spirochaetota bacterium]
MMMQAVKKYIVREQEYILFQFGLIVLFAGIPISTSVAEIGKAIILVAFVISLVRKRAPFTKDIRVFAALALVVWMVIASAAAAFAPNGMHALSRLPGAVSYALLFVAVASLFNYERDKYLFLALFAAVFINGTAVIAEFIRTRSRNGGLFHPVMSCAHIWPSITFLVFSLVAYARRPAVKTMWMLFFLFNAVVIACLFSSLLYILFPLLLTVLVIIIAPKRASTMFAFLVVFAAVVAVFTFQTRLLPQDIQLYIESLLSTRPTGMKERAYFWQGTIELIKTHPLLGIGTGMWKFHFYELTDAGRAFVAEGMNRIYYHPHNTLLAVAAEYGIPALAALMLWYIGMFWYGIRTAVTLSSRGRREFFLAAALLMGFLSVLLQGTTDYTLFSVTGGNLSFCLAGIFVAAERTFSIAKKRSAF